jgi:hypothetical protein
MAEAFHLPWEYVDHLIKPGLLTTAGRVRLDQYLCSTRSNGGNDGATSFYKNFRWIRTASGERLQDHVGGPAIDLALKGQGNDKAFVKIWNFMLKNKDLLDKYTVEVCDRAKKDGSKNTRKSGKIKRMYFDKMSDAQALQTMVEDRFFGMDCIGFVANYLIWVGEWDRYHSVGARHYPRDVCKINIDDITEVKPLDFMCWPGHVALIDWVWKQLPDKRAEIDMCQSSSGKATGPQTNGYVTLRQTGQKGEGGKRLFTIDGGNPLPPVRGHFTIWRREGFWY